VLINIFASKFFGVKSIWKISLVALLTSVYLFAFSQDSTHSPSKIFHTSFTTEEDLERGNYFTIDTTLAYYHYYHPNYSLNFQSMGNIGSPVQQLFYQNRERVGFDLGIHFLDEYENIKENIRYYDVRKPYTKVLFTTGSKKEQNLNAIHAQRITRKFYAGFFFNKISSDGFYLRQKSNHTNLHFYTKYETNNNRYGSLVNYIYNKLQVEENGGIIGDSLFENNLEPRRDAYSINLLDASNLIKSHSFYFKQYLNFGQKSTRFDYKDSVDKKIILPTSRLYHSIQYLGKSYTYEDTTPDSIFYLDLFNYNSALPVFDSIHEKKLENEIGWKTVATDYTNFHELNRFFAKNNLSLWAKHQQINVTQNFKDTSFCTIDTSFQNYIGGGTIRINRIAKFLSLELHGNYVWKGYNKDNYLYKGTLGFHPDSTHHQLNLTAYAQQRQQDFIHRHYCSSQFLWDNNFKREQIQHVSLDYSNKRWGNLTGVSYQQINNPIYFDVNVRPNQAVGTVTNLLQAYISQHFIVKSFHLKTRVYYQKASGSNVIRVPAWILFGSLYFENYLFKKATYTQIGVDVFYNSAYFADDYMPLTRQFYLQNEMKLGGYPYMDFFINAKISKARVFFKVTHFNSGLMGFTYYQTPHYPMPDRAFRLGINWQFLD